MFRKSITVFFILLANIILLTHAVIPHHHHKSDLCIVNNVENTEHDHCATHNHKQENKGNTCDLNQIVVIATQQIRYEIKDFEGVDYQSPFNGIQAVLLNKSLNDLFPINTSNTRPPFSTSTYPLLAGNSIGLRAPPIS